MTVRMCVTSKIADEERVVMSAKARASTARAGAVQKPHRSPRKSLRDLHRELTRRKIAEAARHCFVEFGFDATAVEDVLEHAEVSRTTFYAHFSGKHELLLEFVREAERERRSLFAKLLRMPEVNSASVRKWLVALVDAHRSHEKAMQLVRLGVAAGASFRKIVMESRSQIIEDLGVRFPRFAMSVESVQEIERKRFEAFLMISQIEQLCAVVVIDQCVGEDVAIGVMAERLTEFLT